jgi:hypothetical protein
LSIVTTCFDEQIVGAGTADRLVFEAAGAIDLRFVQPVEQHVEIFVGLARKTDDEGRADSEIRTDVAPGADAVERLLAMRGPPHVLQNPGGGVLERDVEVGEDLAFGHQRDRVGDMRVGVDVVQPHPDAHLAEFLAEIEKLRLDLAIPEQARLVFHVDAVGAGVLRDDQQFLHTGLGEFFGLAQHVSGWARDEVAAERRDDAEGAAVVAALGNLEIGVVARCQLHALRRQQVDERVVCGRRCLVHGGHDAFVGLRPGDGEHVRVLLADQFGRRAHAAGDDDLAVFLQRGADRPERLLACRVKEAAGVDDDEVGAVVLAGDLVAFGPQARQDPFGIDERFRASKADKTDAGRGHSKLPGDQESARSSTVSAVCKHRRV